MLYTDITFTVTMRTGNLSATKRFIEDANDVASEAKSFGEYPAMQDLGRWVHATVLDVNGEVKVDEDTYHKILNNPELANRVIKAMELLGDV